MEWFYQNLKKTYMMEVETHLDYHTVYLRDCYESRVVPDHTYRHTLDQTQAYPATWHKQTVKLHSQENKIPTLKNLLIS